MRITLDTRPWSSVEDFYRELIVRHGWDLEPMLRLVRRIRSSPLASILHATTSVDMLRVGRAARLELDGSTMTIKYEGRANRFMIQYQDREDFCGESDIDGLLKRNFDAAPLGMGEVTQDFDGGDGEDRDVAEKAQ